MRSTSPLLRRAWILVLALSLAFLVWTALRRADHVREVTQLAEWSVDLPAVEAASHTGYAKQWRRLILPEHNNRSYEWIAQTQQMLAAGEWRLRRVDYDNAPQGRAVETASAYRWWLAAVATLDRALSNRSLALAVEHAAIWADPLLHGLLTIATSLFVARFFGALPAALVALACIGFFPFTARFSAGASGPEGLAVVFATWSVLPIAAALRRIHGAPDALPSKQSSWLFAVAAIAGAFGLWITPDYQWQFLAGLSLSAALANARPRRNPASVALERGWRLWGLTGCAASLLLYAVEFFPDAMSLRLDAIHPLFAIAWLGAGELIAQASRRATKAGAVRTRGDWMRIGFSTTLLLALPVVMIWTSHRGWLADDPESSRLVDGPASLLAPSFSAWLARDGMTAPAWTTLLPLTLAVIALPLALARPTSPEIRASVIATLGPVIVAASIAFLQLRAWGYVDAALLALVAAAAAKPIAGQRSFLQWGAIAAALVSLLGVARVWPAPGSDEPTFLATELQGAIERDLSHWLANRSGETNTVVLAPPDLTTSLAFHGGLRGIGTLNRANHEGFAAATRIASATSRDEALALLQQREVRYIVMPSWDNFLDQYVQLGLQAAPGSEQFAKSLIADLHRWNLPPWLAPVPYRLPTSPAFAGFEARVFEIVAEQDRPTALSRLADYFIETNQIDLAASLHEDFQRFPSDLGALVAIAQIDAARGDTAALLRHVRTIEPLLSTPANRRLRWDRRVALAIVLVQANRTELAKEQVRRCVAEISESHLRRLSTASLLRFHALCRLADTEITDAALRRLALELLPPDLRSRL